MAVEEMGAVVDERESIERVFFIEELSRNLWDYSANT